MSPAPTVAATLAIVSGVKVVGESAAYSPDGAWFAFTARPSDDSAGRTSTSGVSVTSWPDP